MLGSVVELPVSETMQWCDSHAGFELEQRFRGAGLKLVLTSTDHDLDVARDLEKLFFKLKSDERAARKALWKYLKYYFQTQKSQSGERIAS